MIQQRAQRPPQRFYTKTSANLLCLYDVNSFHYYGQSRRHCCFPDRMLIALSVFQRSYNATLTFALSFGSTDVRPSLDPILKRLSSKGYGIEVVTKVAIPRL